MDDILIRLPPEERGDLQIRMAVLFRSLALDRRGASAGFSFRMKVGTSMLPPRRKSPSDATFAWLPHSAVSKPVAMTVIRISSPIDSSTTVPKMMFASSWASAWIIDEASLISWMVMLGPPVMFSRTPRAPWMVLSSRSGEEIAFCAASTARLSPLAVPVPIRASPICDMTFFTSAKSRLISPGTMIRSEIPLTAW